MGLALVAMVVLSGCLFVKMLGARAEAETAQQNAEAAMDSSRVLSDSLDSLNGRQAAERLALQVEVTEKDEALQERERQLGATARTLTRIRLERDNLVTAMEREPVHHLSDTGRATYTADTASIHATVIIRPSPDSSTQVQLRIRFEPVEVLQSFLQDEDGRVSLLAIADSIYKPTVVAPPIFMPPPRRGLFNLDLGLGPVLVTGLGCGAAAGMAHLLGSSNAEVGVIGGACAGAVLAFKLIL